ncbi:MAG: ACP S-malonyltransferase [Oscillospiraceae bacterium]|nr:ACP S-malonyltransferase [Oscillospiraceae bacterium]
MSKTVFLFSGQGSQYPGMAAELIAASPKAAEVFSCASDILGFDLKETCLSGTAEELAVTTVAQPAIMATSLAALACVREAGIEAEAVAGHSLGEYAAMVAAGMLSMEDGFRLIAARAAAMGRCAAARPGSMAAILGLTADEVAEVCEKTEGYVLPVNYNSAAQTVIAGETAAVTAACETFAAMGKRAVPLAVSAAFHSAMMQPAADEFYEAAKGFTFAEPKIDFYANLTGERLTDFLDMPGYLARHIVSPVRFTSELAALQQAGFDRYLELGPGKVLTGLVKKTLKGVDALNVENQKTLEKALG